MIDSPTGSLRVSHRYKMCIMYIVLLYDCRMLSNDVFVSSVLAKRVEMCNAIILIVQLTM